MRQILFVDELSSWPEEILSSIKYILSEEARVELKWSKVSKTDRMCRMSEVISDYAPKNQKKIELNNLLLSFDVMCYHYTRLTDQDVQSIKTKGLLTLNEDEHKSRLIMLAKEQDFSCDVIRYIENFEYNAFNGGKRVGNLHFVYSASTCDDGLDTFLQTYGGEITFHMLYNYKKEQDILNKNSKPYVVKFKISYKDIETNFIIENMLKLYKDNGKISCYNCGESYTVTNVECEQILGIMPAEITKGG